MVMETIPVIASVDDLADAVAHGEKQPSSRWFIMRRATQLGADDRIPESWLESMVAAFGGNREKAAAKGEALDDGSFPIPNVSYLKRAIAAYGRAKDKPRAKQHIIKRAKALDAVDQLPDDWKTGIAASAVTAAADSTEGPSFTHNDTSWSVTEALLSYAGGEGAIDDVIGVINDCAVVAEDSGHMHDFEMNTGSLIASFANGDRIDSGDRDQLEEALTAAVRHVRTPEGVKFYGQPIGSVIVPNVYLPTGLKAAEDLKAGDFFKRGEETVRLDKDPVVTASEVHLSGVSELHGSSSTEVERAPYIVPKGKKLQTYRSAPKGAKATLADSPAVAKHTDPWYPSKNGGYTQSPEHAIKRPDGSPKSEVDDYKKTEPSYYELEINNDGSTDAEIKKHFADAGLSAERISDNAVSSHSDPIWRISGPKDKLTTFAHENDDEDAEIKPLSSVKKTPSAHAIARGAAGTGAEHHKTPDDSVAADVSSPTPEPWDKRGNKIAVGDTVEGKRVSKVNGRDITFDDGSTAVSTSVRKDAGPDSARVFQTSHQVGSRSVATAGDQKLPGTGAEHVAQSGDVAKIDTGAIGKTDVTPPAPSKHSPAPAKGAAASFISGKQKDLGTVDHSAKGSNPERFVPKKTFADGVVPAAGQRVSYKKDAESNGTIVETYQLAAAVRFPDGKVKVVSYSQLNDATGSSAPQAGTQTALDKSLRAAADLTDVAADPVLRKLQLAFRMATEQLRSAKPDQRDEMKKNVSDAQMELNRYKLKRKRKQS